MAWSSLKEQGALRIEEEIGTRSATQVIVSAILVNVLNPKLSIFFLAFLPQFVSAEDPQPLARMLTLSAVFMLLTFVVFVGYGIFAASVRTHLIARAGAHLTGVCRPLRRGERFAAATTEAPARLLRIGGKPGLPAPCGRSHPVMLRWPRNEPVLLGLAGMLAASGTSPPASCR
jgi:hypothetical protein